MISSAGLRAEIVPAAGARIVSLRSGDREWLAPSTSADLAATQLPGAAFVRPGMGGWDEVIPTVAATQLPDGTELADHGEAWNRAWTVVEATATSVGARISLDSLPLSLERTITATAGGLRLTYLVVCDPAAGGPLPVLWSAHPQFAARPGTVVRLRGDHPVAEISAPGAASVQTVALDTDVLAGLAPGTGVKAFLPPGSRCAGGSLVDADDNTLALGWDPEFVPYLGLWWDNGMCADRPVIAIEPTTGHGDDAAAALAAGQVLLLEPGERHEWWIEIAAR